MRKIVYFVLVALVVLCASCSSTEDATQSNAALASQASANTAATAVPTTFVPAQSMLAQASNEVGKNGVVKPLWAEGYLDYVKAAYPEGYIVAVGNAKYSTERTSTMSAMTRARAELATSFRAELDNLVIDTTQDAGDTEATQMLQYLEQDIIQRTIATISNATLLDKWESKDGEVFVLLGCDVSSILNDFERLPQAEMAREETYENLENQVKLGLR